ncbi:hypothetical protein K7432_015269 [Basidiobolus ranarum]|uniref:Carrier domain-containing protein n=1 Tax=Basidiobolus ranarum TaxID=34480 RepID=A0ABR2VNB1_9FUNG
MPINASGKTDFQMLQILYRDCYKEISRGLMREAKETNEEPLSPIEKILQEVWGSVLNIEKTSIGVKDSFYHLGGDSISAIQISSQCRQKGVEVSVQSILQHPNIHQLGNYAEFTTFALERQEVEEDGDEVNEIPLTPIQHQFFGLAQSEVHHFHLSWLVKVQHPIETSELTKALHELTSHHDMLRVRFSYEGNHWCQRLASNDDKNFVIQRQQVSGIEELKASVYQIQRSLNIETGPISSFILYDLPSGKQLMFMTIHHYVIDLVSWRIIWEDIEQLLSGKSLLYKTIPFRNWSKLLTRYAESLSLRDWPQQLPIQQMDLDTTMLPYNTMDTVHTQSFTLDDEYTKRLFGISNDAYRTEAVDFMLSSLAVSYCEIFNSSSLTIATEGHGREPWDDSLDISRTVGWFTSIYPVTIERNREDSMVDVLKRTKDIRRGIPRNGFTYGLLRYLHQRLSHHFANDSMQVGFNYLGRFQHLEKADSLFQDAEDEYKFNLNMCGPQWRRMNAIEVEVTMQHNNLCASISYSDVLHQETQIVQWLQSWRDNMMEAINICANKSKTELTTSDLPLLALNAGELNEFMHKVQAEYGDDLVQNIEDIYPCSPIQEGLILGNSQAANFYHVQDVYNVASGMDLEKLLSAWQIVIHDLPILRTVFISNPCTSTIHGAYLQIVLRQINIDLKQKFVTNKDMDASVKEYLEDDVNEGFPLGQPNIRLCLIRGKIDQLVISRHHAINDGWSDKITMRYLDAVYNNSPRPAVIPYRDYMAYRTKQEEVFNNSEGSNYWATYLADIEPCIFPTLGDSANRVEFFQKAAKYQASTQTLKDFSNKIGVSLLTLLQAAWGLVLKPYYEKEDFVYGIITNGRNIPMKHIDQVIGPCISTSPLRIQYDEEATVINWLQSLHRHTIAKMPFENCGLRKIKQWSRANEISLEFDTILNFQVPDKESTNDNIEHQMAFVAKGIVEPTEYKLSLNAWTEKGELCLRLDYTNETLTHCIAECLLDRLMITIDAIVKAREETQIGTIPNMSSTERSIIDSFSVGGIKVDETSECLHHLFETQVMKTPKNVAIQYENSQHLSYETLNKQANQLAHFLIAQGVASESIVLLCLDKSIQMIVAILAILKAGGAYTPIDPNNPTDRNRFIQRETQSTVTITTNEYKHKFEAPTVILLDDDIEMISRHSSENPKVSSITSSNLCYVIYTSGSTGIPKGVMLEHTSVATFIRTQQDMIHLTTEDTVLQFTNYTFDVSVGEIFAALSIGAQLALAHKETLLTNLEECINIMNATYIALTPTIASYINPEKVPSVQKLMVAGEMLTTTVKNSWSPKVKLSNGYGPTETAVLCLINRNVTTNSSCSNVGKPFGSNRIYILDSATRPVPLGVVGEFQSLRG